MIAVLLPSDLNPVDCAKPLDWFGEVQLARNSERTWAIITPNSMYNTLSADEIHRAASTLVIACAAKIVFDLEMSKDPNAD